MSPSAERAPFRWRTIAGFGAVFLASVAAYRPVLKAGYIWDDDGHVTRPELRSLAGLRRIWFDVGATQQYYPVLHSAFWIEHRLWGDAPLGYHLLNVLLHATAACLFILILQRLASVGPTVGRPSNRHWPWFAGLLFALHPVCVESVAWVSEQKNTLSAVFYLLAALAYLRFKDPVGPTVGRPGVVGVADQRSALQYLLATLLFLLALLTKSVTATLPGALLVVLWWRQGRLSWRRDVVPLLPWFALGAAAGLLTSWVERTYIGARGAHFDLSWTHRVMLAGRAVWFYLGKLVWPADLIFIYPRWDVSGWPAWRMVFPGGVMLLAAGAWLIRRRSRGPLAGILFFVGTLFPALGFVSAYPFVFSYVADHFQYLACMGIFALAAGAWGTLRRVGHDGPASPMLPLSPRLRRACRRASLAWYLVPVAVLTLFGALTWRQCRVYRDMETLYRATVDRNPASWLAQDNLGVVLASQGRVEDAIRHYEAALRVNPDYPETHDNYGNALARLRRWPDAAAQYREALRLRPDFAPAAANWARSEYDWANALGNAGHMEDAIEHYFMALRLRPDYAEAMADLGLAEAYSGRLREAVDRLRGAIRLRPDSAPAHAYLGYALAQSRQWDEAVVEYRASLRLNSRDPDVHYQLATALRALGRSAEATEELEAGGSLEAARRLGP